MGSDFGDVADQLLKIYNGNDFHKCALSNYKIFIESKEITFLVETAFWSSLQREESHFIRYNILLMEDNEYKEFNHENWNVLKLERNLEFKVETLIKLAAAVDIQQAGIAVSRKDKKIWGIIRFGTELTELRTFKRGSGGSYSVLVIRVDGPGIISIEHAGTTLIRYSGGNIEGRNRIFLFDDDGPIKTLIEECCSTQLIKQLLATIRDLGHGGTICLLPNLDLDISQGHLDIKYRIERQSAARVTKSKDGVDFLASLTMTDGAVLLDRQLNVFSFGTFISASMTGIKAKKANNASVDLSALAQFDTEAVGARHRSGILFSALLPDSVVFVVSQDGGISCFRKLTIENEPYIVIWKGIGLSRLMNI